MANCRWKRRNTATLNLGGGRATVGRPASQLGPHRSREQAQLGQILNRHALGDQASKAYVDRLAREMDMLNPLVLALMRSRLA